MKIIKQGFARCQACGETFYCGDFVPQKCPKCIIANRRVHRGFAYCVAVKHQQATQQTTAPDQLQPSSANQGETE
jgi:hypothetical protein